MSHSACSGGCCICFSVRSMSNEADVINCRMIPMLADQRCIVYTSVSCVGGAKHSERCRMILNGFHSFKPNIVIKFQIYVCIWKCRYTTVTQSGLGWQVQPGNNCRWVGFQFQKPAKTSQFSKFKSWMWGWQQFSQQQPDQDNEQAQEFKRRWEWG